MSNEFSTTTAGTTNLPPAPRYDESVAFLRRWLPDGPWALTSVVPDDRTSIQTRTFYPKDEDAVRRWLADNGSHRNIYFSVNPTSKDLSKKAERVDIKSLIALHVDIDPRAGEDVDAEQARALSLLTDKLPQGVPPPSLVIFSGGGYQGFWRLAEPLQLDGTLPCADEAKRWNLQLELLFGADHCHNIDRIMRLPGTVNRPDAKKRAKGRKEALARVHSWTDDTYPLAAFTKAPQVQVSGRGDSVGSVGTTQRVKVSGNLKKFNGDVNLIPTASGKRISDRGRVVIVQGKDPDEPNKYGDSRSEWLFFACCEMVRAGVSNDDIYAVITDPNFGISASVLDKGSGVEKYALRQIERAQEEAVNPRLRELNERHAIIANWGGKCRVAEWQEDETLGRSRLTKQSFDDFRNRYMHIQVQIGTTDKGAPITKPLGQWWLQHDNRRQFDKLIFAPGREVPGAYNLWRGFACEERAGDCKPFLRFLLDIICAGNKWHYRYLIRWFARVVQKPGEPGYSAVVMKGLKGIGKTFMADAIGSLLGRHYMTISDAKHFTGNFNSHLRDVVLLLADEAFYAGNRQHEATLKRIITARDLTIEGKGLDVETAANCLHVMLASNNDWVVPASWDERRFFVLKPSPMKRNDTAYFDKLAKWLDGGGRETLLHYLLNLPLSQFNVRAIPDSDGLQEQKDESKDASVQWIEMLAEDGVLPGSRHGNVAWSNHPDRTIDGLYADARRRIPELRFASDAKLGRILRAWKCQNVKNGTRGWEFPSLTDLRKSIDARYGPREWPKPDEWPEARDSPF